MFAALGGGYAVAFSGSGKLQKAAVDGIPTSFTDVRSLTGFGVLQAQCDTGESDLNIRLDNTSGAFVSLRGSDSLGNEINVDAVAGEASMPFDLPNSLSAWVHITKLFSDGNKAQVNLMLAGDADAAVCAADEHLRVLALNTQE